MYTNIANDLSNMSMEEIKYEFFSTLNILSEQIKDGEVYANSLGSYFDEDLMNLYLKTILSILMTNQGIEKVDYDIYLSIIDYLDNDYYEMDSLNENPLRLYDLLLQNAALSHKLCSTFSEALKTDVIQNFYKSLLLISFMNKSKSKDRLTLLNELFDININLDNLFLGDDLFDESLNKSILNNISERLMLRRYIEYGIYPNSSVFANMTYDEGLNKAIITITDETISLCEKSKSFIREYIVTIDQDDEIDNIISKVKTPIIYNESVNLSENESTRLIYENELFDLFNTVKNTLDEPYKKIQFSNFQDDVILNSNIISPYDSDHSNITTKIENIEKYEINGRDVYLIKINYNFDSVDTSEMNIEINSHGVTDDSLLSDKLNFLISSINDENQKYLPLIIDKFNLYSALDGVNSENMPLFIAAATNSIKSFYTLLKLGADINHVGILKFANGENNTISLVQFITQLMNPELLELTLFTNTNYEVEDGLGQTPFSVAVSKLREFNNIEMKIIIYFYFHVIFKDNVVNFKNSIDSLGEQ